MFLALVLYVDDIMLSSSDLSTLTTFKSHLHDLFIINDLSPVKYFLVVESAQSKEGIYLSQ